MDKDDFLGDRRHALEEAFFKRVEAENLAKLRTELDRKSTREELGAILDGQADLGNGPLIARAGFVDVVLGKFIP